VRHVRADIRRSCRGPGFSKAASQLRSRVTKAFHWRKPADSVTRDTPIAVSALIMIHTKKQKKKKKSKLY
jgi:hypothetical protein